MNGIDAIECLLTDLDERIGKLQAARGHLANIRLLLEESAAGAIGAAAAPEDRPRRKTGRAGRPAAVARIASPDRSARGDRA